MYVKDGVVFHRITAEMRRVMVAAEVVWLELGLPREPTITSAADGKHMAGSKHYQDQALDIRIWQLRGNGTSKERRVELAASKLSRTLGRDYDVVVESDHIHVEYDPKGSLLSRFIAYARG